jgi:hypothetical protein
VTSGEEDGEGSGGGGGDDYESEVDYKMLQSRGIYIRK